MSPHDDNPAQVLLPNTGIAHPSPEELEAATRRAELEERIRLAELDRLQAEAGKLLAEKRRAENESRKLRVEYADLRRHARRPWYRREKVVQAAVAGALSLPILWWYYDSVVKPISQSETYVLKFENDTTRLALIKKAALLAERDASLKAVGQRVEDEKRRNQAADAAIRRQRAELDSQGVRLANATDENERLDRSWRDSRADAMRTRAGLALQRDSTESAKRQVQMAFDTLATREAANAEWRRRMSALGDTLLRRYEVLASGAREADPAEAKRLRGRLAELAPPALAGAGAGGALRIGSGGWLEGAGVRRGSTPNRGGSFATGGPRFLLLHGTGTADLASTVSWLSNPQARASAHVVIGRDGSVVQLLPFGAVAFHVGTGSRIEGVANGTAIGIEMVNVGRLQPDGSGGLRGLGGLGYRVPTAETFTDPAGARWQDFTPAQVQRAVEIGKLLAARYPIAAVYGHHETHPGRKVDPGPALPLERMRREILGGRLAGGETRTR